MKINSFTQLAAIVATCLLSAWPIVRAQGSATDYFLYVVCESADEMVQLHFSPGAGVSPELKVEHEKHVGLMPTDINGPHGIAVSPDKRYVYISIAHGRPYGSAWKFRTGSDELVRFVPLGLFPATMDISHSGSFIFVANANFHGDMAPSSVSVVATEPMAEIKRITTCIMPHGSRLNPQGTKQYSACMMDDAITEIDTTTLTVSRYFVVTAGKEKGMQGAMSTPSMEESMARAKAATCVPTWAQPSNDGSIIYVACNKSSEIVAIDANSWTLSHRFKAGPGAYNLAMTKDGRLIVTNKRGQSVSIFDPASGKELALIPTKRKVVHGAVITPDNAYAFITEEGIGSEPGTVEAIDLKAMKSVATVDVGAQAAGIDFWKSEDHSK